MKNPEASSFEPGLKKRRQRRRIDEWRFTPEDLARLVAAAADRPGRGWHYANTNEARAKGQATRARQRKARQRSKTDAWFAARAARVGAVHRNGSTARVLYAFPEGQWIGLREVIGLSGVGRDSVHAIVYQKLAAKGLIERSHNPAYSGKGTPWTRWSEGAGKTEPQFLWRITEAGRAIRAQEKTPA